MRQQPSVPRAGHAIVTRVAILGLSVGVLAVVAFVFTNSRRENAREFFESHRDELDRVTQLVADGTLSRPETDSYYGPELPDDLDQVSVTGKVTILDDGSFFIPRWTGLPDDAGGFWHSGDSPDGRDMYGMFCVDPVDLDGDWWACGLDW